MTPALPTRIHPLLLKWTPLLPRPDGCKVGWELFCCRDWGIYSPKFLSPGRKAHHPCTGAWAGDWEPKACAPHTPAPYPAAGALPAGPAAPPSAWAALCSPQSGVQLSPALGPTVPLLGPRQTRWRPLQEERLLVRPQRSHPCSQRGVGECRGQSLDPQPGGCWNIRVGWRKRLAGDLLLPVWEAVELARLWAGPFLLSLFQALPALSKGETEAGTSGCDCEARSPSSPCMHLWLRKPLLG